MFLLDVSLGIYGGNKKHTYFVHETFLCITFEWATLDIYDRINYGPYRLDCYLNIVLCGRKRRHIRNAGFNIFFIILSQTVPFLIEVSNALSIPIIYWLVLCIDICSYHCYSPLGLSFLSFSLQIIALFRLCYHMGLYSEFSLHPVHWHFWSGVYIIVRTPCQGAYIHVLCDIFQV